MCWRTLSKISYFLWRWSSALRAKPLLLLLLIIEDLLMDNGRMMWVNLA